MGLKSYLCATQSRLEVSLVKGVLTGREPSNRETFYTTLFFFVKLSFFFFTRTPYLSLMCLFLYVYLKERSIPLFIVVL